MWQYFIEIFSNTSDQARLFIVLITTAITITIVFINHYLQKGRNRKELLTSKVEELYLASNRYSIASNKLLTQIKGSYSDHTPYVDSELSNEVKTEFNNIDMLINLYFKSKAIPLDDFELSNFPISRKIHAISIVKTEEQIANNKFALDNLCKELAK